MGAVLAAVTVLVLVTIGASSPVAAQSTGNLASSGRAAQSTTSYGGSPERAIDGNTSGNWRDASVTATDWQTDPSWEVEIGPSIVNQVVIWNRTDCCVDRLKNAWVFVSPTPFGNRKLAEIKADKSIVRKQISGSPRKSVVDFGGASGNYVRVQLEGANRLLSLAEVEVIGTRAETEVKLANPVQSSTSYDGVPGRAIDGNTNGSWNQQSVTHTDWQVDPWWQAEFPQTDVYRVNLWSRTDCCRERLEDAWVFVSDVPFGNKTIAQLKNDPAVQARQVPGIPDPQFSVNFSGAPARYVRVQLEGPGRQLSLAEVKVSNRPTVTQSSTGTWNGIAGDAKKAIDGNLDGNWLSGSISHTAAGDKSPWWNIELSSTMGLGRIEIFNRTDCCGSRTNNLTVRVSTTADNACTGNAVFEYTIKDFNSYYGKRVEIPKDGNGKYPVAKSVCIKKNTEFLSLTEVAFRFPNKSGQFLDESGHIVKPLSDYYFGYSGWNGAVQTTRNDDDDIVDTWANDLGESEFTTAFNNKWFEGNMYAGKEKVTYCQFERHVYPFGGDDVINMYFPAYKGPERRRCGHHVSGYTGSDTFNFVDVDNVTAGKLVIGRINDYDVTRDRLQIDGVDIDPYNPPSNVRFVAWNGDHPDKTLRPQIWIVITSKAGGEIFYAMDGQRYQFRNGDAGNAERHFVFDIPADLRALPSIPFEDVHTSVSYDEFGGLPPGSFQEYYRYTLPEDGVYWEIGQDVTMASDDARKVDVIHGSSYQNYSFAGAGNDLIAGGGAYDLLFGENGNDKIWAGTEDDEAFGGSGNDRIEGNWGNDIVAGGDGNDEVFGDDGDDLLFGDHLTGSRLPANYWHITNAHAVNASSLANGTALTLDKNKAHQVVVADDDATLGTSDSTGQVTKSGVEGTGGITTGVPVGGTATYQGYYKVRSSSGATGEMALIHVTPNLSEPGVKPPAPVDLLVFKPGFKPGSVENIKLTSGLVGSPQNIAFSDIAELLEGDSTSGGNDVIEGGAGNDEMWGGNGSDTFVVGTASGQDVIADFDPTIDLVRVVGASRADLTIGRSGNDAIVTIRSSSVRFVGRAGQIGSENFTFG